MNKSMLALIGMIITLVFVIVAFMGPWYAGEVVGADSTMYLTEAKTEFGGQEMTIEYDDLDDDNELKGVFGNTYMLTIVTLIFAILSVLLIALDMFNIVNMDMMKMLASIFVIITFILALVAAIYFMTALPGIEGMDEEFFQENAGPGYGWYLMLVGAIIALVSGIFMFMDKSKGAPLPK